jgi:eukaryotic-like serine/threonine-protein kinase
LAREEAEATSKENVLRALDRATAKLRAKLGESLRSVQRFDTPIQQATTPSLEAFQAYSLGREVLEKGQHAAALPFFQRAISIDPTFAMAYASLGIGYSSLGETHIAAENTRKAYELREHVSERERFYIEAHYHEVVTRNLEKARQAYELWGQTYPRDPTPPNNLGSIYAHLGQYDVALAKFQEAFRLDPENALTNAGLTRAYAYLGRLEEAKLAAKEAQTKKLDSPYLDYYLYGIAFLQNDTNSMDQQATRSAGNPGVEDILLNYQADTAAYFGQLAKAREFSRRAAASAERTEGTEMAARYQADAALREALFGNRTEAGQCSTAALALSNGQHVQYGAALALLLADATSRAYVLGDDLVKRFPEDTVVQFNYLPTIRAQLALNRNQALTAIEALRVAAPYELSTPTVAPFSPALYPVYVRGKAYLGESG